MIERHTPKQIKVWKREKEFRSRCKYKMMELDVKQHQGETVAEFKAKHPGKDFTVPSGNAKVYTWRDPNAKKLPPTNPNLFLH